MYLRLFILAASLTAHAGAVLAQPQSCLPPPDEQTAAGVVEPSLIGQDSKGRDFSFYDKSYALLIGETAYQNKRPLPHIRTEFAKLRLALESNGFTVFTYYDLPSKDLANVFESFVHCHGYNSETRLLVYFAGHGATRRYLDGPVGYALPIDIVDNQGDSEFLAKALRLGQFVEWASAMEVKHALFVFDSCFSGSIFPGQRGDFSKPQPSNYVFSKVVNLPLREFLTAGSADQTVPAQSTFAELFAQALLGERPEADVNRDGYLVGSELITFMKGWVPRYVSTETPDSGRISDPRLDRGDFIFKLPDPDSLTRVSLAASDTRAPASVESMGIDEEGAENNSIYDPSNWTLPKQVLLKGDLGGAGPKLLSAYETESFLTTNDEECLACPDPQQTKTTYDLSLGLPNDAPADATLAPPQMSCVSGDCSGRFEILEPPALASDSRTVHARLAVWGKPSTWRLTAKILVPDKTWGKSASVVDTKTGELRSIPPNQVALTGESVRLSPEVQSQLQEVVLGLESNSSTTRKIAVKRLSRMVQEQGPEFTSQIIRGTANGSSHYRLGVSQALSSVPWESNEMAASIDTLSGVASATDNQTLKKSIGVALRNSPDKYIYAIGNKPNTRDRDG
jgi:hypothetical protein